MTEIPNVSIEQVRALVGERQRYDDWLTTLDAKKAETPVRVFERVHGDYSARRRDVIIRLSEHVTGLTRLSSELEERLASLASRLDTLEDERAEAMLRTAVGEFDADRWEKVRLDVETHIAELAKQRLALQSEGDEVRALLESARAEPDADAAPALATAQATEAATPHVAVIGNAPDTSAMQADESTEESLEVDDALAIFSHEHSSESFAESAPSTVRTPLLDGLDVFDDSELGDLRMAPPAQATATATPSANRSVVDATNPASAPDGFDDLAFLRSVVDPSAQSGMARPAASGTQQKTLRCTECSTMNLPTEWYCERCGGELAAF